MEESYEEFNKEFLSIKDEVKASETKIAELDKKKEEPDSRIEEIDKKIEQLDTQISEIDSERNDYIQRAAGEFNTGNDLDQNTAEYRVTERNREDLRDKAIELYKNQEKIQKEKEKLEKEKEDIKKQNEKKIEKEKTDTKIAIRKKIEDFKKSMSEKIEQVNDELEKKDTAFKNTSIILERFKSKLKNEKDVKRIEHTNKDVERYTKENKDLDEECRKLLDLKRKLQSLNKDVLAEFDEKLVESIEEDNGFVIEETDNEGFTPKEDVVEERAKELQKEEKPKVFKEYQYNGRKIKETRDPLTGERKYYDTETGKEFKRIIDVKTGLLKFEDIEEQNETDTPKKYNKEIDDDLAPIEEIFNGRKEKEGPRDTEIDIPMDEEKQKLQRVEIKRDEINQAPKRSTTITPQEHDIEVPGAGNDYSEIKISKATENKDFGISKIEISEATGNVKVFDLDGEPIFEETYDSDFVINRFDEKNKLPVKEPDTRKDGFITCSMYGTLNDLLAKVESTCNSEEEIERSQDVDPRVINALYKIAIDRNSKEPLNYLKDYLFSMVKEKDEIDINNNVIPFQMEYNLKDIYNTDLKLEEIKKIQEVSNAAQKMNKEYVSVKKDFFAKRAFYKIKKQLVERKQNKAIAGGDAPSSKVPNKAKRIIKGIYRKAVIHGMYLKGKIKRENPKKTKLKVREYESKFMKDLDVRDYLADRQKSKSEEPKRIKTEDLEKDFSESEALDIDDDEFVLAPKNKSEYEDGDVPKEGIDFVTGGRELDD